MRKFHSIAALCGDGIRPELQALFDRLEIDRQSELFVRPDGMTQSGPDPDLGNRKTTLDKAKENYAASAGSKRCSSRCF